MEQAPPQTQHHFGPEQANQTEHVGSPPMTARKKQIIKTTAIVLGVCILVFGLIFWLVARAHESTNDAYVTGNLHAVSSRVPGNVEVVAIDDNEQVHAGQVLVRLDPHTFEANLAQAQAALAVAERQAVTARESISLTSKNAAAGSTQAQGGIAQAEAGIETANAAVVQAEAGVVSAKAQQASAQATLEQTEGDDKRYTDLVAKEQVSRQQYDRAHAAYKVALANKATSDTAYDQSNASLVTARANVREAEAMLTKAQGSLAQAKASFTDVDVHKTQYEAAQANVAQARASVDDAQLQLSYTVIKAPVDGTIGSKSVETGQHVQPGQALLSVVAPRVWIVANFKETQLTHMQGGQPVAVKLDTFPSKSFLGHVQSFSPASGSDFSLLPPDDATGNFIKVVQRIPVKILLDPDSVRGFEGRFAPGMSAVVKVTVR